MVYLPHFPKIINNHNKNFANDNSLKKLQKLLPKFGNPQNNLPPTIHIAGTNGKGSVAATLASIFQANNYKTHIYSSPHLHHCNERIVIANHQIDDGYLYETLEEVRIASEGTILTLFEALTLVAILVFNRNPADICIIETGMGGRIDATNVIDKKIVTILTSISMDHQEFLGNNLFAIACEKSHIMRSDVPCVVAPQTLEAGQAIELRSLQISNPLIHFDHEFKINLNSDKTFNLEYQNQNQVISSGNFLKPALQGWHQYLNSSLAIAAIHAIKHFKTADFNISHNAINKGLQQIKWPSRLEKLDYKFLKENDELWIDGAHNQSSFEVLADWVEEQIFNGQINKVIKRHYLIVGFTKNKVRSEFFYPFRDIIDFICSIRVAGEPNPEEADVIIKKILESKIDDAQAKEDLSEAIDFLVNLDKKNPCRIIICGSFYLARDFRKIT
jgi:dihydrofolate synthase/folylpolyglutamate synthase